VTSNNKRDLAELYGVETKNLNRQVKRNIGRFPEEFMFRLSVAEKNELVTNWHRFAPLKHSTVLPYVFTEHGVAMLASVLNSERAVKISVLIIRVFIRLKGILSTHKELAQKLTELERKVEGHDSEIKAIFDTIRRLMMPPESKPGRIGFVNRDER